MCPVWIAKDMETPLGHRIFFLDIANVIILGYGCSACALFARVNNVPNIWCSILVAERWFSIRTVFQCCLLIEELQWWLPVRDQSFALCCPTPSSVRRTVGVCESFPEHCAIFLCIEVHLDWVVLLCVRLVSTETVSHPCEVEVVATVFLERRWQHELWKGCSSM